MASWVERLEGRNNDFYRLKSELSKMYMGTPKRGKRLAVAEIPEFLRRNFLGIGLGEKRVGRCLTGIPCVTFFVKRKIRSADVPAGCRLPSQLDGIDCDVVGCRDARFSTGDSDFSSWARLEKLRPGGKIGVAGSSRAGTIGAFIEDEDGKRYLVSNCHVLSPIDLKSANNRAVYQPPKNLPNSRKVAEVVKVFPLSRNGLNTVDLALALIKNNIDIEPSVPKIGTISSLGSVDPEQEVFQFGAGSNRRKKGKYRYKDSDFFIKMTNGRYYEFKNVMVFSPNKFVSKQDSGSFIVKKSPNRLVAQVVGEAGSMNLGIDIGLIKKALRDEFGPFRWIF